MGNEGMNHKVPCESDDCSSGDGDDSSGRGRERAENRPRQLPTYSTDRGRKIREQPARVPGAKQGSFKKVLSLNGPGWGLLGGSQLFWKQRGPELTG